MVKRMLNIKRILNIILDGIYKQHDLCILQGNSGKINFIYSMAESELVITV